MESVINDVSFVPKGWEIDSKYVDKSGNGYFIRTQSVEDKNYYNYAYIPFEINNKTSIVEYNPGTSGFSDDFSFANIDENIDGSKIIYFNSAKDSEVASTDYVLSLQQNYGLENKAVDTIGYSAGYEKAVKEAAYRANLGIEQNTLILVDGRTESENKFLVFDKISSDELEALKSAGVELNLYENSVAGDRDVRKESIEKLSSTFENVNTYYSSQDHGGQRDLAIENGILNGKVGKINYQVDRYENGINVTKYDFILDYVAELKGIVDSFSINNNSNISSVENGSIAIGTTNELFNKFAFNDITFLNSVYTNDSNILEVAKSIERLDVYLSNVVNQGNSSSGYECLGNEILSFGLIAPKRYVFNDGCKLKVNKAEIQTLMSEDSPVIKALLEDIEDTQKLIDKMQTFIDAPESVINGIEWDAIKEQVLELKDYANKKSECAKRLISAVQSAYNGILLYMEDYEELDTSVMEELYNKIQNEKQQIETIKSNIANTPDYEYDEEGNIIVDNTALKKAWSNQLEELTITLKEDERHYDKLENLSGIDALASDKIYQLVGTFPELPVVNALTV